MRAFRRSAERTSGDEGGGDEEGAADADADDGDDGELLLVGGPSVRDRARGRPGRGWRRRGWRRCNNHRDRGGQEVEGDLGHLQLHGHALARLTEAEGGAEGGGGEGEAEVGGGEGESDGGGAERAREA